MRKVRRRKGGLALIYALSLTASPISSQEPQVKAPAGEMVAIVCQLRGTVTAHRQGSAAGRSLRLLDLLGTGSVVRTGQDASAVLAWADGRRFDLGAQTEVFVGDSGPRLLHGAMDPLPAVSVLPRVIALLLHPDDRARLAATRVRSTPGEVTDGLRLDPPDGARVLAEETVLRFSPVEGVESYQVRVQDTAGRTVFAAETDTTSVELAPDLLQPGQRYYWRVRTGGGGAPLLADALLRTVGEAESRVRRLLVLGMGDSDDPSLQVLLAGLDLRLGLRPQGCRELRQAVASMAHPEPSSGRLIPFECQPGGIPSETGR